jgi:hypothetical protein
VQSRLPFCFCSLIVFLFCSIGMYSRGSMMFDRYRSFTTHTEPDIYQVVQSGNFEDNSLKKYTVENTVFALLLDTASTSVSGDDLKNDLAAGHYILQVFTKEKEDFIFHIKTMKLSTSEYSKDIQDLIFYRDPEYFDQQTSFSEYWMNTEYRISAILGGDFRYPRPKDMKFSIELEIEITSTDNIVSYHSFTYFYTLEMQNHWIRTLW